MVWQHIRGWFGTCRNSTSTSGKRRLRLECLEDRLCPSNISIINQPMSQTVAVSSSVTVSAVATGHPVPTLQWQGSIDGGTTYFNVAGATADSFTFTAPRAPTVELFRAVFTNSSGQLDSHAARITVDAPPAVTTNPAAQTGNVGGAVTFTAAATGTPAPSVQWQVSHDHGQHYTNIPFADTDTLSFVAKASQNGDRFRAVFRNRVGTTDSSAATLTVDFAPSIAMQPLNQTVPVGSSVTVTATANGSPAPSVQWFSSTDGKAYTPITGATANTYTFTAPAAPGSTLYRATFTNALGTATTAAARITADVAPTVTANPAGVVADAGQTVTFTAAATGTPSPHVQWQVSTDGGKHFANLPLDNTNTLTFIARPGQNHDQFRAVFTNAVGQATTSAATLTVDFGPVLPPAFTQTVATGSAVTLRIPASGNRLPAIQWWLSADHGATYSALPGATSYTYTFTAPTSPQVDLYKAVLTNSAGTITSPVYTVIVDAPPAVTANPVSQTVNAGAKVTFTVAATGTPTPHVQWQESTDGGGHFRNLALANTDSLTFIARAGQNGDEFRAVFTNAVGKATTSAALLTVDFAPSVTMQPSSQVVAIGSSVTLSALASGNPAPAVQWFVSADGGKTFSLITGATAATYTFTAPLAAGASVYRAVFTNALGHATTHDATVTVDVAPTITANPVSQTAAPGTTVTFTATGGGTPTGHVQWQESTDGGKHFTNIPFADSDTLMFIAKLGQSGDEFRAVFTNAVGQATTSVATLTVHA